MSFYFYDTETSGLDPKWQRIMQFAGIRTDENFNPIGEPHNWLVKLTPEVLPDPQAILVTGITPQKTLEEGYSEQEFTEKLQREVFTPQTIALGYNSLRFDDEFVRYTLYRNFYDPYEREWSDQRGRWDLVDLVRMTRALRPEGIQWPVTAEGKATNRLEALTQANTIEHGDAHDALSDVRATIAVARLLREAQPKLFEHLLSIRHKSAVRRFLDANSGKPVVHSSSRFSSDNLGTSVVVVIAPHPTNQNAVLAYDLRYSPKQFADLSPDELAKVAFTPSRELAAQDKIRLPIKAIHLNKSPALAPIGVLDESSQRRINLNLEQIRTHLQELESIEGFGERCAGAWEAESFPPQTDADAQLYDGFLNEADRTLLQQVRNKTAEQLADFHPIFSDERMNALLIRYKARSFRNALSADEKKIWEQYRAQRLAGSVGPRGIEGYMSSLSQLAKDADTHQAFLLEELRLYGESIMPFENEALL